MERQLRDRIRAAGLTRPAPVAFGFSLAAHVALLAAALAFAGWLDHPLWRIACALAMAFAMVQVGFAGHDLDHGTRGRVAGAWLGLACWNLLLGTSLGWWRDKHRRHHRDTHVVGRDPDLYALFAYEGCAGGRRPLHAWFVRHQAVLFWITLAGARAYYQVASVAWLARRAGRMRGAEAALIALHHALLWGAAVAVLGSGAPLFILVGYAATGLYMGLAFGPNHLGCPHAEAPGAGRLWQVAATRNIRAGRLGDYLFGGLNLQIEHHLLPHVSRFRLRRLQPIVREFCREQGVAYRETGYLEALAEIRRSLAVASRQERAS